MRWVVLVLLSGCAAERVWVRAGATDADWKRDRYTCVQESRTAWGGGGTGVAGAVAIDEARGDAQRQADELFAMCLEARGWHVEERGGAGSMMAEILTPPRRKSLPADAGR